MKQFFGWFGRLAEGLAVLAGLAAIAIFAFRWSGAGQVPLISLDVLPVNELLGAGMASLDLLVPALLLAWLVAFPLSRVHVAPVGQLIRFAARILAALTVVVMALASWLLFGEGYGALQPGDAGLDDLSSGWLSSEGRQRLLLPAATLCAAVLPVALLEMHRLAAADGAHAARLAGARAGQALVALVVVEAIFDRPGLGQVLLGARTEPLAALLAFLLLGGGAVAFAALVRAGDPVEVAP